MKSTSTPSGSLSIGEVAERFGLATHVLRHWESVGLLAPARTTGSRREYTTTDLYRVAAILRAKEAGFGLDDIETMLTAQDPRTRSEIMQRHRREILQRIAEQQAALELIDCALDCDHADIASCPTFQALLAARVQVTQACALPDARPDPS